MVLVILAVIVLVAAALGYASWRTSRRPVEAVVVCGREPKRPGERRVVCAGDSLTQATMSFDYVGALRERMGALAGQVRVLNAGVNGDLAFNLAQRLDAIIAADPDDVVIMIGTNDVCGAQNAFVARLQRRLKKLPELASLSFFERELSNVLQELSTRTHARLFVVTPPLLGEDLEHGVHGRLLVYVAAIERLAAAHGARVLLFHDVMARALQASGHAARPGFHLGAVETLWGALVPLQRFLLGMSFDQIAKRNGLWGSPDLIHLNETAGELLVNLIADALHAVPTAQSSTQAVG
jgi:lysophospholipase L1-like esterase